MNKTLFAVAAMALLAAGCEQNNSKSASTTGAMQSTNAGIESAKAIPTPTAEQLAEYKKTLSPNTYHILFEAGTEPPFRNDFYDNHAAGTYVSAATGKPLFSSEDKYDSGTGWPSFTKPISADAVIIRQDNDGSGRDEVLDASSGGHLGHVFDDGPADKGGKRYCMNSGAMKFVPKK